MITTILPSEVRKRIDNGERLYIIDVREPEEIAAGTIPGSKHIPLAEIPSRLSEIDTAAEVIMVCRSGNRSGKACVYLQSVGYANLKNMAGGMLEWPE